jgi:NADPH2:quinone reductase
VKAAVIHEFGPPSVLVAEPVPEPQGEVLVEVEFASITFIETIVRAGRSPMLPPPLPAILGNGVGGTAEGRRVITTTGGLGGYAERAAVPRAGLIDVPDELALDVAVALLADGRTAVGLMRGAQVRPGETVLVEAAAGGVGSLLVQLARDAGAHVVAAAGAPHKLELARELGAQEAVAYERIPELGCDVVFDGVGGRVGRAAFEALRPGGRMSSFGLASGAFTRADPEEAAARGVTLVRGAPPTAEESSERTRAALALAAEGRLRPVIGQRFPLAEAAAAHAAIEARATVGKTLLVTAPS